VTKNEIDFNATAILRKYPSLNAQKNSNATFAKPYLLHEGTLDECINELLSKPVSQRNLYEIHTCPQPPLVTEILRADIIVELARLREFL
jgi:hypothetical protein